MSDDKSAAARKADRRKERAEQAAKLIAEQKRQERRSTFIKVGSVVAAMVVIIAICVFVGIEKSGGGSLAAKYAKAGTSQYSLTVGKPTAPHKVVMYEDFQCPVCDAFELAGGTQLQQLASEGKVYLDYRPIHLLPEYYSEQSANAWAVVLKASGPTVALQFHNLLYRNQPSETTTAKASPGDAQSHGYLVKLVNLAVQAGAQRSAVQAGIMNMSQDSWVKAATNQAENVEGVSGTPTIILDGKRFEDGSDATEWMKNLIKAVS